MIRKILNTTGLLLLFIGTVCAQSAQSTFNDAFSSYEAGNYEESLLKAAEVETILGSTNSRIQSLKALNYYEKGDPKNALLELEIYFTTNPDVSSSAYSDMETLRKELKMNLQQSFESNRKELERKREEELAAITSSYSSQKDLLAFEIAKEAGTIQALELFLRNNKSENLRQEAQKLIELEKERIRYENLVAEGMDQMSRNLHSAARDSFLEAAKIKSDPWLQQQIHSAKANTASVAFSKGLKEFYLEDYAGSIKSFQTAMENDPNSEVQQKLQEAKEEFTFQQALARQDPGQMKVYLKTYPKGNKRYLAEIFLFEKYIALTKSSLSKKNYSETEVHLEELVSLKSLEHWPVYSPAYYELVLQQARQLTEGKRSLRKANIGLAIAHYQELDADSGEGYKSRLAFLKWRQKEWNRPDMLYFVYKTDPEFNDIGFELGSHDNSGLGLGINVQFSKQLFTGDASSEFELMDLDHLKGLANLTITKKVLYPLWLYAGGGYANLVPLIPNEDNSMEIMDEENQIHTLNFTGGVNIHFKPVVLTLGASYPIINKEQNLQLGLEEKPFYITVGAGIGW